MKTIVIILALLFSAGNIQAECLKHERVLDNSAEAIAYVLNCGNYRGVREDVEVFAEKIGFCKHEKGLPKQVCSIAGKFIVGKIKKQIPARWLCRPDIAMKVVEMAVIETCKRITLE